MKPGTPLRRTGTEAHAPEPDEMLMARFIGGDSSAFDALFTRYAGRVNAYLRRMVGPTTADDLTQTTFLSVVRSRGRFQRGAKTKEHRGEEAEEKRNGENSGVWFHVQHDREIHRGEKRAE